ncbi:MAG: efflux RND transporter periplasmic adaptor subunit, partial [Planctomycetota bacterium]
MKASLRSRLPLLLALLLGLGLAWVLPARWLFVPDELASAKEADSTRYACPMFCVVLDELPEDPRCPVCRMQLAPISDTATLDRHEQWISGLQGVALTRMPLVRELRLYGEVAYDEQRIEVVSSRMTGWIEELTRRVTWEEVQEGEVLAEIFSPELQVAQQELLIARGLGEEVVAAAREKLSVRYGLDMRDVDSVLVAGTPLRRLPFRAPTSGVFVRRSAVQGAH